MSVKSQQIFTHKSVIPLSLNSFENERGRFYHVHDSLYPSVTTVLGSDTKQQITEWRDSMGHREADIETARCAARGTEVHNTIEQYLLNNPIDLSNSQYPDMFRQIRMRLQPVSNIRLLEGALYSHQLKIAGRVDCIADYDNVPSIIDFKTSTRFKQTYMIDNYFLQCAAYSLMYEEVYGETIDQYVIIVATERAGLPQVFKGSIRPHINSLVNKICSYHRKFHDIQ